MPIQTAMSCLGHVSYILHMASIRRAAMYLPLDHGSSYFSTQQTAGFDRASAILLANDCGGEMICVPRLQYSLLQIKRGRFDRNERGRDRDMDAVAKLQRCKAPLILQDLAGEIYGFTLALLDGLVWIQNAL